MAEGFDAAIRRRLDIINGMGQSANENAGVLAQKRASSYSQSYAGEPMVNRGVSRGAGGNNFDSFVNAIVGRESGGRYGVVNRDSGALGKYQIMPGNVASWSKQALGYSITPQQFLKSPSFQDKVAKHQLQNYYSKWGPEGAAVAWYAGPGTAKKYMASGGQGYGRKQGKYSSISSYALGILKAMGLR